MDFEHMSRRGLLGGATMLTFASLSKAAFAQDLPYCKFVKRTVELKGQRADTWSIDFSSTIRDVTLRSPFPDGAQLKSQGFDLANRRTWFGLHEVSFSVVERAVILDLAVDPNSFEVAVSAGDTEIYRSAAILFNPRVSKTGDMKTFQAVVVPYHTGIGPKVSLRVNPQIGSEIFRFIYNGGSPSDVAFSIGKPGEVPVLVTQLPEAVQKDFFDGAIDRIFNEGQRIEKELLAVKAEFDTGKCKKPKSGCFVTTACCEAFGKADDCWELTALRRFRDGWLARQNGGSEWIALYYATAPKIVDAISSAPDADAIYHSLYRRYLLPSALLSKAGFNRAAFEVYRRMMLDLGVEEA